MPGNEKRLRLAVDRAGWLSSANFRRAIFYGLLLALWQVLFNLRLWPEYLFPSPEMVFRSLVTGFSDKSFLIGIAVSMKRLAIGYGVSLAIGITTGLWLGNVRLLDQTLGSLVLGLQNLPSIAWLPLSLLWFGLNEKAIVFVVIMGALFSITIATEAGVKNIPPIYRKAARTMGAKGYRYYLEVMVPASLPGIITGMKQAWSFAWRSLMGAELLFVSLGLGQLLMVGRELNDMGQVIAVMIVVIGIGIIMDTVVFAWLERRVRERWGLASQVR
ncbi:MAG: ABC transporter permease [Actinobacteria bacterium]|nr:ABC transporter permease [Actinomycetota bacterium]